MELKPLRQFEFSAETNALVGDVDDLLGGSEHSLVGFRGEFVYACLSARIGAHFDEALGDVGRETSGDGIQQSIQRRVECE
jgi:hypothetical protein